MTDQLTSQLCMTFDSISNNAVRVQAETFLKQVWKMSL